MGKRDNHIMKKPKICLFIISAMLTLALQNSYSQEMKSYMRIARITVDSLRLDEYTAALKEQMQSALKLEKGVLAYAAVQDKKNPEMITILETYASVEAYQAHIQTEHFKKYKAAVADMVMQLELVDVNPIVIQSKLK